MALWVPYNLGVWLSDGVVIQLEINEDQVNEKVKAIYSELDMVRRQPPSLAFGQRLKDKGRSEEDLQWKKGKASGLS